MFLLIFSYRLLLLRTKNQRTQPPPGQKANPLIYQVVFLSHPPAVCHLVCHGTLAAVRPVWRYAERIHLVLQEHRQALEVVAGGHHGHGHRGTGLAYGTNELAAHVPHLSKGVLDTGSDFGNALVAFFLVFTQRLARFGLALDVLTIAQHLEHFAALCAGVAFVGIGITAWCSARRSPLQSRR